MKSDRWKQKYSGRLYLHDRILLLSSVFGACASIIVLLFVKPTSMLFYEPFLVTMVLWAGLLIAGAFMGVIFDKGKDQQETSLDGGIVILVLLVTALSLSFSISTYTVVGYLYPEHLAWALVLPIHGALVVVHSIYLIVRKKVYWDFSDLEDTA